MKHAKTFLLLVRKLPGNLHIRVHSASIWISINETEKSTMIFRSLKPLTFLLILGARDIIFRMLDLNPRTRWSFEELKYHPWLAPPGLSPISSMYHGIVPSSCNVANKNYTTGKYLSLNIDPEYKDFLTCNPCFRRILTRSKSFDPHIAV